MQDQQKEDFYNHLHRSIGRELHVYFRAVRTIRSMYFTKLVTSPKQMSDYAEEKLARKKNKIKRKVWRGVIDFCKDATPDMWHSMLIGVTYEPGLKSNIKTVPADFALPRRKLMN